MQIPMDMMTLIQSLGAFAYASGTNPELAEKLQTQPGSQVDKVFGGIELMYTFRESLDNNGLTLLGQLAGFGVQHGWVIPGQPDRLQGIYDGCRRDLGEAGTFGAAADDPVPQTVLRADGKDWRGLLVPNLDQVKAAKRDAVKQLRAQKEQATCATPAGVVQIDDASKTKINGLATMAMLANGQTPPAAFSVGFILADNTVKTLDANGAIGMAQAVGQYVNELYAHSVDLYNQIAAVTPADTTDASIKAAADQVNAIDITAGWPA